MRVQTQNVSEYKAVREELDRVRNCVTSYVSFVVLGSGPAFAFLAGKAADKQPNLAMGFASILLGIVATLVLFLLSYKFTSHNRFAGYSKLLTHERFDPAAQVDPEIFFWEICLDKLRASDSDEEKYKELIKYCQENKTSIPTIPDLQTMVEPYSGPSPEKNKWAVLKGWPLMFFMLEESGSWKLPLYIARIFGAVTLGFVTFAVTFSRRSFQFSDLRVEHYCFLALAAILMILWFEFVSKLYRQMLGSETVEAFCRKFVPIRLRLLRELNSAIGYGLIGVSISKEDEKGKGASAGAN